MSIPSELHGNVFVIRPRGDISKLIAAELGDLLAGELDEGTRLIVFDFSNLTHVSSDGLRVMLQILRRLRECEGRAAIVGASEHVYQLLNASGFLALLEEFDSDDDAIDAMLAG